MMNPNEIAEFKKNIDFVDLMFRMSCASTRLAFGAGLEMLPFEKADGADEGIRNGRARLRRAILSQIKEFESLLKLVDG